MRSYKVYAIDQSGGPEIYQDTVHSSDEGKRLNAKLKREGWGTMKVYDCLGGLQFQVDLQLGRVTYSARQPVAA